MACKRHLGHSGQQAAVAAIVVACVAVPTVEAKAALLDQSQLGTVYDGIGKRYGLIGKAFNFFSKLRGGMENNVALELRAA